MDEIAARRDRYEGRLPKFRDPQLATLVDAAPEGDDWLHETKFDGYRCLAALGKGGPVFYSRSGKDWSDRFGALEGAFAGLDCDSALIDGEVMAAKIQGSPFSSLQKALSEGAPLVFFAFDLLELDGEDLTGKPQEDRRARLETLLRDRGKDDPLRLADCIRGHGPEAYRRACKAGGEGIVSKKADAPYRGARTKAWLKVKCTRRQEFVIGGYSPSDKRGRPFASLLLGEAGENGLRYRGRVGTGFDQDAFDTLKSRMRTRKTSPFDDVPRDIARDAVWVAPELVAEVDFTEFTADGHVRHGRYLGLREDKNADEVKMERPRLRERRRRDAARGGRLDQPPRPRDLPRGRLHQGRSRPLLREGRRPDDRAHRPPTPGAAALPGRDRRPVLLPEASRQGLPRRPVPDRDRGEGRRQGRLPLRDPSGVTGRGGADGQRRDPRLGRPHATGWSGPTG